jgi:hypothetical protein
MVVVLQDVTVGKRWYVNGNRDHCTGSRTKETGAHCGSSVEVDVRIATTPLRLIV